MIQALKGVAAAIAALLAVAGGALVLAYGVVGVALDWAPLKGPIESRLSAALGGRGVEIRGALDVDLLSRHPRVSLWDVAIANADWGSEPYMFEAQRLTVALDLPALLSGGPLALPYVGLLQPDLLLERSADGRTNWDFGGPDEGPPDIPEIRSIALHEGAVTYRDPAALDEDLAATALEAEGALPAGSPVSFNASGRLQGEPLDLRLAGGSLAELEGAAEPYPLDLGLWVGDSSARVAGTAVRPLDLQGLDVEVAAESADASVLRSLFGLPDGVDSYHLDGRVSWDGESWAVSDLDARLGESDLRGSAGYTAGGERPVLRAELVSDRLNLDQLRALAAPAEAGEEEGPAAGGDGAPGGGFDPERLLASLDDLQTFDAEIAYTAGAIEARDLPVRSAALGVRLQDGVLDVQPLRADLTEGRELSGSLHLDANQDPVPVEAALEVGETSLRVAGTLDRPPDAGPFGLDVTLRSPDPSVVTSLLGWPPDALPALAFEGRIGREADAWVLSDFGAEVGPSDLRGSLRIDEGGERPSITGELASNRFDLDQLRQVADRVQALAQGEGPDEAAEGTAAEEPADATDGDGGGFWDAVSATAETLRAADADLRLAVDTFEAEAVPALQGFAGHLRVDGGELVADEVRLDLAEGTITGTIRADASGGDGDAIPVTIVASAGDSTVRAEGRLTEETSLEAFTLELDGEGQNLATLNVAVHPFADWSLPETPPYRVDGTLVHEGGDWAFDDFRIAMGRSDLVGTLRYRGADGEGERPLVTGSLTSTTLDLPEVLMVAGLRSPVEEEVEEEEVAGEIVEEAAQMDEAEDAAEAEEEGGGEPVLPDPSLQLAFLREFDAEIDYRSGEVTTPQFPVQNLALGLRLEGGVLTVDPLEMEGGGGRLTAPFVLNAAADPTEIELDARLRGFDTRHIMTLLGEQAQEVAEGGRVSGRVVATARGNALREALGAATGEVAVVMEGGWISSLVVEVFGFDLGEALAVWFVGKDEGGEAEEESEEETGREPEAGREASGKDEETDKVAVRCLVGDFNLRGGVLTAETLVLDTTDTNVVGGGTIDLGSEALDLTFEPHAKDASVLTAQTPIHIQGTFGDVEVNPDRNSLLARGAAALGLGVLIPVVGAVIPFIQPGLGEDSDCRGLIEAAGQRPEAGTPTATDGRDGGAPAR